MDDQRLIARLRAVEGTGDPRPAFVEDLHAELAGRLGLQPAAVALPRPRRSPISRLVLVAATVALLLALAAGGLLVGSALHLVRLPVSVLETIRSDGAIRVAVRPDSPQVMKSSGGIDGFDVEFAGYAADWLGVDAHLVPTTIEAMLDTQGDWQLGLPSQALTQAEADRFAVTDAYYAWPIYLVTLRSSDATYDGAVNAGPLCAAEGSAAEAWLRGDGSPLLKIVQQPPASAAVHLLPDDAACLEEVRKGTSAAFVTSQMLPRDFVSSPDLRLLDEAPVAFERRAAIVPRAIAGDAELVDELNSIIRAARSDGSLAALSRQWFGGEDLTVGLQ